MFRLKENLTVKVRSGRVFSLKKGVYCYCGSAMGSLEKRVLRHLKREKKRHWHLDFITTDSRFEPVEVWVFREKEFECSLAESLKGSEPVVGFGATDCRCESHLFRLKDLEVEREKAKNLGAEIIDAGEVVRRWK